MRVTRADEHEDVGSAFLRWTCLCLGQSVQNVQTSDRSVIFGLSLSSIRVPCQSIHLPPNAAANQDRYKQQDTTCGEDIHHHGHVMSYMVVFSFRSPLPSRPTCQAPHRPPRPGPLPPLTRRPEPLQTCPIRASRDVQVLLHPGRRQARTAWLRVDRRVEPPYGDDAVNEATQPIAEAAVRTRPERDRHPSFSEC